MSSTGEEKDRSFDANSGSDMDEMYDEEDDTVNLPDMEQDTMDINVNKDDEDNGETHQIFENEEEEEEQLDLKDLNDVMISLMEHYDNDEDMNKLRETLDDAKQTRGMIQQAQMDPKHMIRGK